MRVAIGDSTCNACHHMVYTLDDGLDTAALTSVSVMLLGTLKRVVQGTTWPALSFFQYLSNDDRRCLKFSLKRDG